ncbi:MAG: dTMP kinase [Phycisphaerales bacterium]|nr:dTMP kinase [Phycisphaerales bacterium]
MPSDHPWLTRLAGRFIAFEGPDGSGKTTQFRRFTSACAEAGVTVCEVREPGGTGVGERIREILLDHAHRDMTLRCEMMLYMASRAQLVEQRIRPAMAAGQLVAADRYLASTIAYQGAAGGLPVADITDVARVALQGCVPDLTLLFDVDEETSASRMNPLLDRMEAKGREYHRRVRKGYLDQARAGPDQFRIIDAARPAEEVWRSMMDSLRRRFA